MKHRLEPHFDTTWQTDIFMEWEEIKDKEAVSGRRERLVSWDIDRMEERTKRSEQEELKELPKKAGCTVEQLLTAYREVSSRTRGGPSQEDTKPERMAKLLKKSGHEKCTPSVVRRFLELLRRYRPELFPASTPPPATPAPPNVVPFKRGRDTQD